MKMRIVSVIMALFIASSVVLTFEPHEVKSSKGAIIDSTVYSIQSLINEADEGEVVFVQSGLYSETIVVNKTITLLGEDRDTTIIDGENSDTVLLIQSPNVTVSGFSIRNADTGIHIQAMQGVRLTDNSLAGQTYGIFLSGSSEFNEIIRNHIASCFNGIRLATSNNNSILNNTIVGNKEGIKLHKSSSNTVRHNLIAYNQWGINRYWPDYSSPPSNNMICHNNFVHNVWGDLDVAWCYYAEDQWSLGGYGNYWNRYNYADSNGDGIGDIPHQISWWGPDYALDMFPLISPLNLSILILPLSPIADFTGRLNSIPYYDGTVTFDASLSFDPDGEIISYEWDFGDNTTDTGIFLTHTYQEEGGYHIKLTVTDNDGLNSTVSHSIFVYTIGGSMVFVDPLESNGAVNDTFMIDVRVTGMEDLYGYDLKIFYNTSVLDAEQVILPPDHFLNPENDPNKLFIIKLEANDSYNSTHGCVHAAISLMAPEEGKIGNGTLFTITFRIQNQGNSTLNFQNSRLSDSNGDAIPHVALNGFFKDGLVGDVNRDRKVDIFDVVLAAIAYDSKPLDANWNPYCDFAEAYGLIDIFDIVVVASHYGEEYVP